MLSFDRLDRIRDAAEEARVARAADIHLGQLDAVLMDDDADEDTIAAAVASAMGAKVRALPARSARYGARLQALGTSLKRRQLGGSARMFGSRAEGDAFVAGLRVPGARLVEIPFLASSTEYVKLVQATAGTVATSTTSMETTAINYLDLDILGFRVWGVNSVATAGCTLPYAQVTLASARIEGGKSALYGEQPMFQRPHTADVGFREMFVPVARGQRRMEANQTAECSVTLTANGTTRAISLMAGVTLIATAHER